MLLPQAREKVQSIFGRRRRGQEQIETIRRAGWQRARYFSYFAEGARAIPIEKLLQPVHCLRVPVWPPLREIMPR
jgi:hypothetical protein